MSDSFLKSYIILLINFIKFSKNSDKIKGNFRRRPPADSPLSPVAGYRRQNWPPPRLYRFSLNSPPSADGESACDSAVLFILKVMIYMVYAVELYPTRVVAIANGMLSLFGMTINTICPLILGSLERLGFNLMLYFFILAIGGCFIYVLLD